MGSLWRVGVFGLAILLTSMSHASEAITSPCAHLPPGFFQNEELKSRTPKKMRYPIDQSGAQEDFSIGGQNRLDHLLQTDTIAGSKIEDLEKRMKSHGYGFLLDYHPMFTDSSWNNVSHPSNRATSGGFLGITRGMQLDAPSDEQRKMVESLSGEAIKNEIQFLSTQTAWIDQEERANFQEKIAKSLEESNIESRLKTWSPDDFQLKVGESEGVDVDLRHVLIRDELKARKLGVNHQEIAAPLLGIIDAFEKKIPDGKVSVPQTHKIKVDGREYTVEGHSMALPTDDDGTIEAEESFRSGWRETSENPGVQGSPFCDGLYASWYMKITDENGKELWIDALTPHLIHRYGFYQGGKYRVPPENIADFFNLGTAAAHTRKPEGTSSAQTAEQHN